MMFRRLRSMQSATLLAALMALLISTGCGVSGEPKAESTPEPTSQPEATAEVLTVSTPTPSSEGVRVIDPPKEITDFKLTSNLNEPIKRSDLKGKVVLLSFGYTNCPDVCPVTLAHFKQVKELLGETAEEVHFIFISVDGARDTPERLSVYLGMFDPVFVGMTGDEPTVRAIINQFNGTFEIKNAGGVRVNYPVEHSTGSYLLDSEGRWVRRYAYEALPEAIAADITKAVKTMIKTSANSG